LSFLSPAAFLGLSAALLGIGLFGILTRRNFILLLISASFLCSMSLSS